MNLLRKLILTHRHNEGIRFPKTAQILKVRKHVIGVKYFSVIGKSSWAILTSEIELTK